MAGMILTTRRTKALQRYLIHHGADLGKWADDGDGGDLTKRGFDAVFAAYFEDLPGFEVVEIEGLTLSQRGISQIIDFETGGEAYYELALEHPTWPGVSSGVTIGVGYDLGYHGAGEIRADWEGRGLSTGELEALLAVAGIRGRSAQSRIKSLSGITISYAAAGEVFEESTLPKFAQLASRAFPGIEQLHPDAQAMLLSLVFNRGASMSGDRRREMAAIRDLVATADYARMAIETRSMKRLWPTVGGLLKRRDAEADIFEGLA